MLLRNMAKDEEEAAGGHCDSSSLISMLVLVFVIFLLLSFALCLLGCSFSSSSQLKGITLIWMK